MSSMLQVVVTVGALWVGFRVLALVVAWQQLLRFRVRLPSLRVVDEAEIAPWARTGLAPGIAPLEALGFVARSWLEERALEDLRGSDRVATALLEQPREGTWALVQFAGAPEPLRPFGITLVDVFGDGFVLRTANGSGGSVAWSPANTEDLEDYSHELSAQLATHAAARVRLAAAHGAPRRLDPEALVAFLNERDRRHFAAREGKDFVPDGAGSHQLSMVRALRLVVQILAHQRRRTAGRTARLKRGGALGIAVPIEAEALAFERTEEVRNAPSRRFLYPATFAVTLALAGLSFARILAPGTVLGTIGVVMLHELGHFTAMRLFGYSNTSIFFIPFFGAATTGRKHDATVAQELVVLLAGPVPGLLLAAALSFVHAPPGWLRPLVFLLISINAFNLVPILPFDGGRVVHLLLFRRSVWADLLFRLITIALLVALGALVHTWLFVVVAALMAIGLPASARAGSLRRALRYGGATAEPRSTRLFRLMAERTSLPKLFPQRLAIARLVLDDSSAAPPGLGKAIGGLAAYGGAIGVAVFALGAWYTQRLHAPEPARTPFAATALACPAPAAAPYAAKEATEPAPGSERRDFAPLRLAALFADARSAAAAEPEILAAAAGALRDPVVRRTEGLVLLSGAIAGHAPAGGGRVVESLSEPALDLAAVVGRVEALGGHPALLGFAGARHDQLQLRCSGPPDALRHASEHLGQARPGHPMRAPHGVEGDQLWLRLPMLYDAGESVAELAAIHRFACDAGAENCLVEANRPLDEATPDAD